jgi:hypothetical protein
MITLIYSIMKQRMISYLPLSVLFFLMLSQIIPAGAQDAMTMDSVVTQDLRPVKNTFDGMWIIDNQTVMVGIICAFQYSPWIWLYASRKTAGWLWFYQIS